MRRMISAALLLTLLAASSPGQAQPAPEGPYRFVLPLDLALASATEAIRVCEANGYRVTATVVDTDGVAQLVLRGDGATVHTAESSFQKAYGVVTLGPMFDLDTSGALFELVKSNPYAPRLGTVRNVMALPGAVAFKVGGTIVAARLPR